MVLLYVALVLLFFLPSKWFLKSFNEGYLDKDSTLPVKGIFVAAVFFTHFKTYVTMPDNPLDNAYVFVANLLNQLVVVMFLFYSGYGIMRSLQSKGDPYVKGFFLRRFVPVFFQFATAVLLFLIMNLCLGNAYDWQTILLSFTGWTNLGNDGWYLFVTFALYILFILVFLIPKLSTIQKNIIHTVLCFGLVVALYFSGKESWWWNTILCFNLGMWYCLFKGKVDIAMKRPVVYWTTLPITIALFAVAFVLQYKGIFSTVTFTVAALFFVLVMVLFTMKVQSKNPVLSFLGKHVFSIFILQRLAFIPLARTALVDMPYLYFFVALAITIVIAVLFDLGHGWLHRKYNATLDNFVEIPEREREL